MSTYLIESRHTPETCLQALDEVSAQGDLALAAYSFGCAVGDHSNHVAYVTVEAASADEARRRLPKGLLAAANVTEVGKFTADQIKSFHQP